MEYKVVSKLITEALKEVIEETDGKESVENYMVKSYNMGAKAMCHEALVKIAHKYYEEVTADVLR